MRRNIFCADAAAHFFMVPINLPLLIAEQNLWKLSAFHRALDAAEQKQVLIQHVNLAAPHIRPEFAVCLVVFLPAHQYGLRDRFAGAGRQETLPGEADWIKCGEDVGKYRERHGMTFIEPKSDGSVRFVFRPDPSTSASGTNYGTGV